MHVAQGLTTSAVYRVDLNTGHRATTRGICMLLWMHLHQLVPYGSLFSCVLAFSSLQVGCVLRGLRA